MPNHLDRSHARRSRRLHEVLGDAAAMLGRGGADDRVLAGLVGQVAALSEAQRGLLIEGWGGPALALCRVQFEAVEWIVHLTEPVPKVSVDDLRARVRARRTALRRRLDDPRFPLTDGQRQRLRAHRREEIADLDPTRHALPTLEGVTSRSPTLQRRLVFLRELLLRPAGGLDLGGAAGTSDDLEDRARAVIEASRWGFAEGIAASRANGLLALRALSRRDDLSSLKGAVRGPKKDRARRLRLDHEARDAFASGTPGNEGTAAAAPESSDDATAVLVDA